MLISLLASTAQGMNLFELSRLKDAKIADFPNCSGSERNYKTGSYEYKLCFCVWVECTVGGFEGILSPGFCFSFLL